MSTAPPVFRASLPTNEDPVIVIRTPDPAIAPPLLAENPTNWHPSTNKDDASRTLMHPESAPRGLSLPSNSQAVKVGADFVDSYAQLPLPPSETAFARNLQRENRAFELPNP